MRSNQYTQTRQYSMKKFKSKAPKNCRNKYNQRGDKDVIRTLMVIIDIYCKKYCIPQTQRTLFSYIKEFVQNVQRNKIKIKISADKIFWIIKYVYLWFGQVTARQIINQLLKRISQSLQVEEKHQNLTFVQKKKEKLLDYQNNLQLLKENFQQKYFQNAIKTIYKQNKCGQNRWKNMQEYFTDNKVGIKQTWSMQKMKVPYCQQNPQKDIQKLLQEDQEMVAKIKQQSYYNKQIEEKVEYMKKKELLNRQDGSIYEVLNFSVIQIID